MAGLRVPSWIPLLVLAVAGAAPAVEDGFAPTIGTAGTHVSITGHGFVPAKKPRVEFLPSPAGQAGLASARARIVAFSEISILVETPRLRPGTYAIRVTPRPAGGNPVVLPGTFVAVAPVATGVEAESLDPGSNFSILGTFGSRKGKVFVGPKKAKVVTWSENLIVAVVPPRLPGTPQAIVVRNQAGASDGAVILEVGAGPPKPELAFSPGSIEIQIPQNCPRTFRIFNTGDPSTTLDYTIADDGALGGFLDFTNPSASIVGGSDIAIGVTVKPGFVDDPLIAGATLVLNVYTPGASNFVKVPVGVRIRSAAMVAQRLVGTWSGTWLGLTYGPTNAMQPQPEAAVSGHWSLAIDTVDLEGGTISGSLTWTGVDGYWTYTLDEGGNYVNVNPVVFVPDRTITFSGAKGEVAVAGIGGSHCNRFTVQIHGKLGAANPSDAFYGPDIFMDLDTETGQVINAGSQFRTSPYNPSNNQTWGSEGTLTGSKN